MKNGKNFLVTPAEQASMRAFCEVLDGLFDEVNAAVLELLSEMPALNELLAGLDPAELERQSTRSRALQNAALLNGEWAEYLVDLREQGTTYALMGVAFQDWYLLLRPYRRLVLKAALSLEPARTGEVVLGMGCFLDIAMSTLAESYLATKQALIGEKEVLLRQHVVELERSNKELDDFAYVASHDLKAPLRDIQTLASWVVEDEDALSEPARRHLTLITERIERMERLLDDLLGYSRAGRIMGEAEMVNVRDVVDQAAQVALPFSGFSAEVRGDSPTIHTPLAPLKLVLRNLMSNAVKHHDRDHGQIEVQLAERAEFIEIAVTDDGPGIAPEFQERVFRMFQTLRPRDEVEGSGMGLALVKKIVESRGGTITLESQGRGTTMRFTWPKETI